MKLDYPGAAAIPGGGNFTGGINDRGDIVGVYTDTKGFRHFMRTYPPSCDQSNSHCQPVLRAIDVPRAVQTQNIDFELGPGLGSAAVGVNNQQDVVGLYATKGLYSAGFKLSQGSFSTGIDDRASSHAPGNGSRLSAINDLGFAAGGLPD